MGWTRGGKDLNRPGANNGANRFKFQSFTDHISHANIDVLHRVRRVDEQVEEGDSFFREELLKQSELDLTLPYVAVHRKLNPLCQSMVHVMHNRKKILKLILDGLKTDAPKSYPSFLALLGTLARDLRQEFYPFFQEVLVTLLELIDLKDSARLEGLFSCICLLFKYLIRHLVADIRKVLGYYIPLLAHKKWYIRKFAAESYAFLIRKIKSRELDEVVNGIFEDIVTSEGRDSEEIVDGVGLLMFEVVKGVKYQFHSRAGEFLPVLTRQVARDFNGDVAAASVACAIVQNAYGHMCKNTQRQYCGEVFGVLRASVSESIQNFRDVVVEGAPRTSTKRRRKSSGGSGGGDAVERGSPESMTAVRALNTMLVTLGDWVQYRDGSRVVDWAAVAECVRMCLGLDALGAVAQAVVDLVVAVLRVGEKENAVTVLAASMVAAVFNHFSESHRDAVYAFVREMSALSGRVSALVQEHARKKAEGWFESDRDGMLSMWSDVYIDEEGRAVAVLPDTVSAGIVGLVKNGGKDLPKDVAGTGELWLSCHCLVAAAPSSRDAALAALEGVRDATAKRLAKDASAVSVACLQAAVLRSLYILSASAEPAKKKNASSKVPSGMAKDAFDLYCLFPSHPYIARACAECVMALHASAPGVITLAKAEDRARASLISSHATARVNTLRMLSVLEPLPFESAKNPDSSLLGPCPFVELALSAEEAELTLAGTKTREVNLKKIEGYLHAGVFPEGYAGLLASVLIGQMHVKMATVWPVAQAVLATLADHFPDVVWGAILAEIRTSAEETRVTDAAVQQFETKAPVIDVESEGLDGDGAAVDKFVAFVNSDNEPRSTDPLSYYSLLLQACSKLPSSLVEKRNRDILPVFFSFLESEYCLEVYRKVLRKKLFSFLSLFSSFKNAGAFQPEAVRCKSVFTRLLTKADTELQKMALKCLLVWKDPAMNAYKDTLERMVDDKTMRDEVAKFPLEPVSSTVLPQHRKAFVPAVVRILFGKMMMRKGRTARSKGQSMHAKRSAILSYVSTLPEEELAHLIHLLLEQFVQAPEVGLKPIVPVTDMETLSQRTEIMPKTILGFLHLLEEVQGKVGTHLEPFVDPFLHVLAWIFEKSASQADGGGADEGPVQKEPEGDQSDDEDNDSDEEDAGHGKAVSWRTVKYDCLRRVAKFIEVFSENEGLQERLRVFVEGTNVISAEFSSEHTQNVSGPLQFILSLSHYENLHVWFTRAPTLLPNIFGCLSSKNVSTPVMSAVMTIAENVLGISGGEGEEEGDKAAPLSSAMEPHVTCLLDNLRACVVAVQAQIDVKALDENRGNRQKTSAAQSAGRYLANLSARALKILARVSEFAEQGPQVKRVVDMLLPFLKRKEIRTSSKVQVLRTLKNLISKLDDPMMMYGYLVSQFSTLQGNDARSALCQAFEEVAERNSSLKEVAGVISGLNAMDENAISEYDYERRLEAFIAVNETHVGTWSYTQLLPVVHCFVYSVHDEDLSVRKNASNGVLSVAKEVRRRDEEDMHNMLKHVLLPALRKGVRSQKEAVRNEFITLFGQLAGLFGDRDDAYPVLADLSALRVPTDPEADWFENVTHLQIHRRARAMNRLTVMLKEKKLECRSQTYTHVLIPIAMHFIHECKEEKYFNVMENSMYAVAAIAGQLEWGAYYTLLSTTLKQIPLKEQLQRILVRLVCGILDNFHFKITDEVTEEHEAVDEANEGGGDEARNKSILAAVVNKILPDMRSYLSAEGKGFEIVRPQVASALVNLLLLLPNEVMVAHLPGVLTGLITHLRNRDQSVRDSTRTTLIEISVRLGPRYFQFILNEMKTLLNRGYQMHVASYTLNKLLTEMVNHIQPGDLDYCLVDIEEFVVDEICGSRAEEKDVEKVANKMKEIKASVVYDTLELLGKAIKFNTSVNVLMACVHKVLAEAENIVMVRKAEEMLRRIAIGFMANPSATIQDTLLYCHYTLTNPVTIKVGGEEEEEESDVEGDEVLARKRQKASVPNHLKVLKHSKEAMKKRRSLDHSHIIIEHVMNLLRTVIKRKADNSLLPMLDPLVPVVLGYITSKHDKVVAEVLKVATALLLYKLPSWENEVEPLINKVFVLVERLGPSTSQQELLNCCFRVITAIIRECPFYTIDNKYLEVLLRYLNHDLEIHDKQNTTFSLIKAIVGRKLVIPEVYDLMKRLEDLMVTSYIPQVRLLCRQVLLTFLLIYPLGSRRMLQHLENIVKNLGYSEQAGRESVLEMMNIIIEKFPDEVVNEHCLFFFLPLVTRLVNDESPQCREMVGLVMKALIRRADARNFGKLVENTTKWHASQNEATRRAAAQIVVLLITAKGKDIEKVMDELLALVDAGLAPHGGISGAEDEDEDDDEESEVAWEVPYYALKATERLLGLFPKVLSNKERPTARLVAPLLLHQHSWVRLASCRVLGLYFANFQPTGLAKAKGFVFAAADFTVIMKNLCRQLDSEFLDDALGEQILKNLIFVAGAMHGSPTLYHSSAVEGENDEKDESASDDDDDAGEGAEQSTVANTGLNWLLKRMSYTARRGSDAKKSLICKFIGGLAVKFAVPEGEDLGKHPLVPHLTAIIHPLYRLTDDKAMVTEDLRALASDVLKLLENQIGTSTFFTSYNAVKANIDAMRKKRRQQRAMDLVGNPEKAAKLKQKKQLQKKESRKRKIAELAGKKGIHSMRIKKAHTAIDRHMENVRSGK